VQRLSFADASFDLCTSTEVFEHVPDDRAGLRE
jgi:ubiquinone/menaquinone biosynthesis C-methylase UbiE